MLEQGGVHFGTVQLCNLRHRHTGNGRPQAARLVLYHIIGCQIGPDAGVDKIQDSIIDAILHRMIFI
eukprot:4706227-Prorocentrum_lima.AAC.1